NLGALLRPIWETPHGKVLIAGTLLLAIVLPLGLHLFSTLMGGRQVELAAVLCALLGGFVLRYSLLMTPPELLSGPAAGAEASKEAQPPAGGLPILSRISPEDGRPQDGAPGADPGNKSAELQPRSKVFTDK